MTNLVRYEAACRALAEAKAVDEVKDIRDKADAMRIYAMQAKNKTLEVDAAEIRIRAERRLGEMIAAQKATTGLNRGTVVSGNKVGAGQGSPAVDSDDRRPTLADAGISKDLSSRAQKLAAVPEAEFEAEMGEWRDRVQEEGRRVTTRLEQSGARHQKQKRTIESRPADIPPEDHADELAEARFTITELSEEVEELRDRLAVEAMDATDDEKFQAITTIKELRAQVKTLEAELEAVKAMRDQYMTESAEKSKQIAYWRKEAKKVAA